MPHWALALVSISSPSKVFLELLFRTDHNLIAVINNYSSLLVLLWAILLRGKYQKVSYNFIKCSPNIKHGSELQPDKRGY